MATLQQYFPSLERGYAEPVRSSDGKDFIKFPPGQPRAAHKLVALVVGVGAQRRRRTGIEQVNTVDLYLPAMLSAVPELFALEPTLEQTMCGIQPECLRCHDLRPVRIGGSAYRSSQREKQPEFHGFSFGNTIELAIEGLHKTLIGVEPNSYSIAAYARPLLWLDYGPGDPDRQLVLYADDNADLFAFTGTTPAED